MILEAGESVKQNKAIGPHSEGSVLDLRCEVSGGKPAPRLAWYQIDSVNGKGKRLGSEFVKNVTTEGNVTFLELAKKLTRQDLNCKLECRVKHEALSEGEAKKLAARVHLDLHGEYNLLDSCWIDVPIYIYS